MRGKILLLVLVIFVSFLTAASAAVWYDMCDDLNISETDCTAWINEFRNVTSLICQHEIYKYQDTEMSDWLNSSGYNGSYTYENATTNNYYNNTTTNIICNFTKFTNVTNFTKAMTDNVNKTLKNWENNKLSKYMTSGDLSNYITKTDVENAVYHEVTQHIGSVKDRVTSLNQSLMSSLDDRIETSLSPWKVLIVFCFIMMLIIIGLIVKFVFL